MTRLLVGAALAVSTLCSFQDRPKYDFGPVLLPPTGKPYREVRRFNEDGSYDVLHKEEQEWDKNGDKNGDGKDDRTDVVGEDSKGNKIICVMLQKSDEIPVQFIAYGVQKPDGSVIWFGKCGFPTAVNGTSCEGKDGDGDSKPDVVEEGPDKGQVVEYSKVTHDNIDSQPDADGKPVGKDDVHYCHFLDGPNEGKNKKSLTKGEWKEQPDGSYKYETDPRQTVECPPTDPPDDPNDVGRGRDGGGGLAPGDPVAMLHAPAYALDGFPIADGSSTWCYHLAVNPPIGYPWESAVGDVVGPDGTYRVHEVSIRAGDRLYLSGSGLSNARVVRPATQREFGSWFVAESSSGYVVFEAATSVLLSDLDVLPVPNAFTYDIGGFLVDSSFPVGTSPAHYMGADFGDWRLVPAPSPWLDLGEASRGAGYVEPKLVADGDFAPSTNATLRLIQAPPNTTVVLVLGLARVDQPFLGGVLVPQADSVVTLTTDSLGRSTYTVPISAGTQQGTRMFAQVFVPDSSFSEAAFSNALQLVVGPH